MARAARIIVPDVAYHVTQRGNNRLDVFFSDDDRTTYLRLLKEEVEKHKLKIHGYCLMTNHVHLVVVPTEETSLAKALGRAHFRYTQHINRLRGRSGHLWQNRFFSCPLDEPHYWTAMSYVERNPVRAGMVEKAWKFSWSSAAAHVGGNDPAGLLDLEEWRRAMSGQTWKEWLVEPDDEEAIGRLRAITRTGRPLGSDSFVGRLESLLGRRLRPLPHGRPKKRNVNEKHEE